MNYLIVNFNTTFLTNCCIDSVFKFDKNAKIYIIDNSDLDKFKLYRQVNVIIFDNTTLGIVDYKANFNYPDKAPCKIGSFSHSSCIEWFFMKTDEDFILLDSDTIVKSDLKSIIDEQVLFSGEICDGRALPMLLWFNTKKLKEKKLHFFDGVTVCPFKPVDTGFFFFQSCKRVGPIKTIHIDNYIEHLGQSSYKPFCNPNYHTKYGLTDRHNELNEQIKFVLANRNYVPNFEEFIKYTSLKA